MVCGQFISWQTLEREGKLLNDSIIDNNTNIGENSQGDIMQEATVLVSNKNNRQKHRVNNHRKRYYSVPFIERKDACGLPPKVAAVFAAGRRYVSANAKLNIEQFASEIYDIKRGKNVMAMSPANIRDLQFGYHARIRAMSLIFGTERCVDWGVTNLRFPQLVTLSDYVYAVISEGIRCVLNKLDIASYLSVEKIIKAGNGIKNYNASEVYGGNTVYDYIRYTVINSKVASPTKEVDKADIKNAIKDKEAYLSTYQKIKSLPFALFDYKRNVTTADDGSIKTPDIEAKKNLRILFGSDYEKYGFTNLSLVEATAYESRLIHAIKRTATTEVKRFISENEEKLETLPDVIRKDVISAASISLISSATKKCLIHEVVSRYENNFNIITDIWKNDDDRVLTESEKDALFQIEYQAARKKPDIEFEYITDFRACLRANEIRKSNFIEAMRSFYLIQAED